MKNVYIYCEGQTEESFVNQILLPYFIPQNIVTIPIVCQTSRKAGKKYKGGVVNYEKIRYELTLLSKEHRNEHITTMFDYYGMPENTPGIDCNTEDILVRMKEIEAAVDADIGMENCHFHFMVHEFEGILFSKPEAFEQITDVDTTEAFLRIKEQFKTPEYINNSLETAPSKRILRLIPEYKKVRDGVIVAMRTGIDAMLEECEHFRNWVEEMKSWS